MSVNINCRLVPGPGVKVVEVEIASVWREGDTIFTVSKAGTRSPLNLKELFDAVVKLAEKEKVFVVSETNEIRPYSQIEREMLYDTLLGVCRAFAIIACKPLGKMLPTLMVLRRLPPFPVKMFEDKEEALRWVDEQR